MRFLNQIGEKHNIIFSKNIADYYTSPLANIFNDLTSIKKDAHEDNDRIVFYDTTTGIQDYYKLINDQLTELDIPSFFVLVISNSNFKNLIKHNIESDHYKILKSLPANIKKIPDINSLCISPWSNIEIRNNGNMNVCCLYSGNNTTKIQNSSLINFYNSEEVTDIRQTFLNNNFPLGCKECESVERSGGKSKRIRDLYFYKDKKYTINWHNPTAETQLTSLDLKVGNLCNLACRICDETASSLWAKEINNSTDVFVPEWLDENLSYSKISILKDIKNLNLSKLLIVGGEPLLNKTHAKILKSLVDLNKSKNIDLHYNTNGTVYPTNLFYIWENFKTVELSLSIDNIFNKFDYERYGLVKWETVVQNINKFEMLRDSGDIILNVYNTVTVFNILDLEEIYDFFTYKNIPLTFSVLKWPLMYNIRWLSIEAKKYISDKLLSSTNSEFLKIVTPVVNIMNNEVVSDQSYDFFNKTKELDIKRNQSFSRTYPELANITGFL